MPMQKGKLMAETLTILSDLSFLLAGAFGTASVVIWLRFDIPEIVGDLSGRAARRSVLRIRRENERLAENETEQLEDIMIVHTDEVIREGE